MEKSKYKFRKFNPDLEMELKKSTKFKLQFDVETAKISLAHKLAEIRKRLI